MRLQFHSIDRKLPILMATLLVATVAIFAWTAYVKFGQTLYSIAGRQLENGSTLVANLISATAPALKKQMTTIAAHPAVVHFLSTGSGAKAAERAIGTQANPDSSMVRTQLLDSRGAIVLAHAWKPSVAWSDWASRAVKNANGKPLPFSLGPIVDVGSGPVMLAIQPVYSRDASDGAVIGYVVEMKKVVGRGRETIEHLVGRGVTMIIGDPGEGVWTDLTSTVPGPPPRAVAGRALRFSASSRGPGIGYGRKIQGTPWMIWMQQSSAQVLAPLTEFLWAIATAGILIAVVGGLLVWVFARSITKRIVTLIDKVELIESDTGSRPPRNAPARDEIERLCDAFERMAARLKAHALKEIEFLHGQKVEAVGRLAAGVAHDFNNILMAIRSFAHFQLEELPQGSSLRENAEEIYKASSRGAELTKQLLAFTRKKDPERTAVNLAEIAVNMTGMLRRLVPKNIDFVVDASSGLWPVAADQTHVEQVIVNLAVNARDAMPRGGVLRLTLSNETVATPIRTSGRQIPAGPYVVLRISDTGVGMTEAVRLRIFEPFFTTKSEGSGTGLGLSTVFSIVDHWDGHITVESRVGVGTTFSVYFPRSLAVLARGSEAVRQADRVA